MHPNYKPSRDRLVKTISEHVLEFGRIRPVVFLCGGSQSDSNRPIVAEYLKRHTEALVFFAEQVWEDYRDDPDANALSMETWLAEIADVVMIVVESEGTFTELGAFSTVTGLRNKVLPILNERYRHDLSFINTGPIKTIDAVSTYKPSIHTDFSAVLRCSHELDIRMKNVPKRRVKAMSADQLGRDQRHLLFFIVDLISLVFPASDAHLKYLIRKIVGPTSSLPVRGLLSLAIAMKLVTSFKFGEKEQLFVPVSKPARLLRNPLFSHSMERAKIAAALLTIPEAASALAQAREIRARHAD